MRFQGHFVAQTFQPPDQGSADSVHVDPVKVVRTEFPVVFAAPQLNSEADSTSANSSGVPVPAQCGRIRAPRPEFPSPGHSDLSKADPQSACRAGCNLQSKRSDCLSLVATHSVKHALLLSPSSYPGHLRSDRIAPSGLPTCSLSDQTLARSSCHTANPRRPR